MTTPVFDREKTGPGTLRIAEIASPAAQPVYVTSPPQAVRRHSELLPHGEENGCILNSVLS